MADFCRTIHAAAPGNAAHPAFLPATLYVIVKERVVAKGGVLVPDGRSPVKSISEKCFSE